MKTFSLIFLLAFLFLGCNQDQERSRLKGADQPYPNAPKLTYDKIDQLTEAINQIRRNPYNCGHITTDSEGHKIVDTEGHYTIVYDEQDILPAVHELYWNDLLYNSASEHTYDMVEQTKKPIGWNDAVSFISTYGSGTQSDWTASKRGILAGSMPGERIRNNGYVNLKPNGKRYKDYEDTGELVDAGNDLSTPADLVTNLLRQPETCRKIMSADYRDVGISMVESNGSFFRYYWTIEFGNSL